MVRPLLDVSEVLTDPMFTDSTFVCRREVETVGADGVSTYTSTTFSFTGTPIQNAGELLQRLDDGTRHSDSIDIYTRTELSSGNQTHPADVIVWNGREYTVAKVLDWSAYGRGFWHVVADLRELNEDA